MTSGKVLPATGSGRGAVDPEAVQPGAVELGGAGMGNRPADDTGETGGTCEELHAASSTTARRTCQEEEQDKRGGMGELRGPGEQAGAEPGEEEEDRLAGCKAGDEAVLHEQGDGERGADEVVVVQIGAGQARRE